MQITQHTTFPVELRNKWNQLLDHGITNVPFLRFEYLQDWWQTRGGGEWSSTAELVILTAHDADQLIGVAPFFIAEYEGAKKLILLGSIEICDFLDFLVLPDRQSEFADAVLAYFSVEIFPKGIQAVELFNLVEESPTLSVWSEAANKAGFTAVQTRLQQAPCISLPGDWDAYLESIDKKQRHEIRRKMRRAAEAEVPAVMYITSDPAKVEEDCEAFLALMAQDEEKAAFLTPAMREQFKLNTRTAFDQGYLQLAFLKIGDENATAYLNYDYNSRIWVYNSGIDRRFMEYSPGWVLLGHLLQWANEHGRSAFDFMRGNEDYKYKFGAVDHFVCRLTLKKLRVYISLEDQRAIRR